MLFSRLLECPKIESTIAYYSTTWLRTLAGVSADDLRQELLLALLNAIESYNASLATFATWFKNVAENRMHTLYDQQDRVKHGGLGQHRQKYPHRHRVATSSYDSDFHDPEAIAAHYEIDEIERVKELLPLLPNREQRVLRDRYFDDQTLEVIGAAMGVSRQRVQQIEARAIKMLRAMMEKRND